MCGGTPRRQKLREKIARRSWCHAKGRRERDQRGWEKGKSLEAGSEMSGFKENSVKEMATVSTACAVLKLWEILGTGCVVHSVGKEAERHRTQESRNEDTHVVPDLCHSSGCKLVARQKSGGGRSLSQAFGK